MNVLKLPDGSTELVLSRKDFQRLIREKLGLDAEEKLIEIIREADAIDTDLTSYEASLESNHRCFNDILDTIAELKRLLTEKRIDRPKLIHVLEWTEKLILNQI